MEQKTRQSLKFDGRPPGILMRVMRLVDQPWQTFLAVTTQPGIHTVARFPIVLGDFNDQNTVSLGDFASPPFPIPKEIGRQTCQHCKSCSTLDMRRVFVDDDGTLVRS